jgi:exodeoxyribonuclease X
MTQRQGRREEFWRVRFRVIDIETTGLVPPAEIIEIGCVDVVSEDGAITIEPPRSQLFRPLHGITPETMAVHHITERDFHDDTPVCSDALLFALVNQAPEPDILVAHNCAFEQRFISDFAGNGLPWICTHKIALRVWPDAPRHSNQVLRYWRGLVLDAALAMPPHRAGPDAWVTAHLLAELLEGASVEDMVEWTSKPGKLPTITFGKHKGSRWPDVPADYLHWMTRQKDMNADAVFCANEEIARRNVG